MAQPKGLQRVLLLPDVEKASGLKRTQIAQKEKDGSFPMHIHVSERRKAWIEAEVVEWQQQQITKRDTALAAKKAAAEGPPPPSCQRGANEIQEVDERLCRGRHLQQTVPKPRRV